MKVQRTVSGQDRTGRYATACAGFAALVLLLLPAAGWAVDTYLGDTTIYTADPIPPNVLLVLDNSGSMNLQAYQTVFDITKTYYGIFDGTECYAYGVNKFQPNPDPTQLKPCTVTYPWDGNLLNFASMRRIDIVKVVMMGGICKVGGRDAMGNCSELIGQNAFPGGGCCNNRTQAITVAQAANRMPAALIPAAGSVYFHIMGDTASLKGSFCVDDDSGMPTGSDCSDLDAYAETNYQIDATVLSNPTGVLQQVGSKARFGLMEFSTGGGDGGKVLADVGSNVQSIITAIESTTASTWTPLAESLYEATRYFAQIPPAYVASDYSYNVTSRDPYYFKAPEWASTAGYVTCCKSSVIIFTDGEPTMDTNIPAALQDYAHPVHGAHCLAASTAATCIPHKTNYPSFGSHFLDDVAYYAHTTDLRAPTLPGGLGAGQDLPGIQSLNVYTFFAFGGAGIGRDILQAAAKAGGFTDLNGNGVPDLPEEWDRINNTTGIAGSDGIPDTYYESADADQLKDRLIAAINHILEVDTSYVAPVVPVSPENRTYSGSRVYLGFFKPVSGSAFWYGNLKKYGIDSLGVVTDKTGLPATNADGSFKSTAYSYWSTLADGGSVDKGGAGEVLVTRATPRQVYTYVTAFSDLTYSGNSFETSNINITAATLGVGTVTEKDKLINFIRGQDAYDANSNLNTTENRRWILGDVLHSKPLVVEYARYTFTSTNESDCGVNKTIIYLGSNDGMLHAFRDCDGSEAWAFVPPDLLANLKSLPLPTRTYFVDGSPMVYIYDQNKDGTIDPIAGDKVVLIFGERRGGGFYYALDVSDPAVPRYLWRRSAADLDYTAMGESWSDPEIVKVKIGTTTKVVAILGAGYDNANEDGRYGATQTFSGTGTTTGSGQGAVTSSGTSSGLNPTARGIYVMEVASLDVSGVPSFTLSGSKVWGYSYDAVATATTSPGMAFSIPSAVTVLDRNFDGYADRFYVGDMGGNVWRFDIGDTSTLNWAGRRVFSANPGSGGVADAGRKIFYRISVTLEAGYEKLFFGTGDREHPLNTAVVDRLYTVKDKGEPAIVVTESNVDMVHELVDVTTDRLQVSIDPTEISAILSALSTKYGWYIKLNERAGEKVLAPVLAFKETYYTTYTPDASAAADPCAAGNLGSARVYVLNGVTGESVFNFDTLNDSTSTTNARAKNSAGQVLLRSDRVQTIRSGIPSGVVLVITADGNITALIGCGGALCTPPPPSDGNTFRLYWRRIL